MFSELMYDNFGARLPQSLVAVNERGKREDVKNDSYAGNRLLVSGKASHSGKLINMRVYPGLRMKDSIHTLVSPYEKPILSSHPSMVVDEPTTYGRIFNAQYVAIKDGYDLEYDWETPETKGGGSGYALFDSWITDEDAIKKFLDQRLLTFSVGFRTDALKCSVCKADRLKNPCDHNVGQIYEVDDKNFYCFNITGNLDYNHIATVYFPADSGAVVTNLQFGLDEVAAPTVNNGIVAAVLVDSKGKKSRLCLTEEAIDRHAPENVVIGVAFSAKAKCQEDVMKKSEKDKTSKPEAKDKVEETESTVTPEVEPEKVEPKVEEPKEEAKTEEKPEEKTEEKTEEKSEEKPEEETEEKTEEKPEEEPKELPEDKLAELNVIASVIEAGDDFEWNAMEMTKEDALALIKNEEEKTDAKMSTSKRKSLPDSSFCGPNRSFPVNDCAHYTAAKRLIGRYKGPGDKSKIMACIERKGKSLTCTGTKKDSQEPVKEQVSSQDFEKQIKRLETENSNLKASLKTAYDEIESLLSKSVDSQENYTRLLADQITMAKFALGKLSIEDGNYESYATSLFDKPMEYLEQTLEDLRLEVSKKVNLSLPSNIAGVDNQKEVGKPASEEPVNLKKDKVDKPKKSFLDKKLKSFKELGKS